MGEIGEGAPEADGEVRSRALGATLSVVLERARGRLWGVSRPGPSGGERAREAGQLGGQRGRTEAGGRGVGGEEMSGGRQA